MSNADKPSESQNCVGIIVATHCNLASELIKTAELIVGPMKGVYSIELQNEASTSDLMRIFEEKINRADEGAGVVIMTDIFGGTPTNIALSLSDRNVDVISGVNLPMLIKAYSLRCEKALKELVQIVCDYAKRHIKSANNVLGPEES